MSSLNAPQAIRGSGIFELAAPGVQGINCGRHVAIQTNSGFFSHHVNGGPGLPVRSFHDLLAAWLAGAPTGPNTVQIQTDNLGACAPEDRREEFPLQVGLGGLPELLDG